MPDPLTARRDSLRAVSSRFRTWNERVAIRRAEIAGEIAHAIGVEDQDHLEMLGHAAWLADAGRSIDPYNHPRHAALIALGADLSCFTHRHLAIGASLLLRMGNHATGLRELQPLLTDTDRRSVAVTGCALGIADSLVARIPPDGKVGCERSGNALVVVASCAPGRWSRDIDDRLRRTTGLHLELRERDE